MHLLVFAKTCIKWSWSNVTCSQDAILSKLWAPRKWDGMTSDICKPTKLSVHNCVVNQMPGLKSEWKNLKWHLHKLKILEAWDQLSWKRMTQIITLHCVCNPFHRLSFWHGSTSWKFYTVQQTMELWTFRSIKQWAQVWYNPANKSMQKKTNQFAQFLSHDCLIHNIVLDQLHFDYESKQ